MSIKNGRFVEERWPGILDTMMDHAVEEIWGEEPQEDEYAALRAFYRPIAKQLEEIQEDIGLVLDSSQIEYAEDRALDLLCALINVFRYEATPSTGEVVFSRSNPADQDYTIPEGTVVQTNEVDPIKFKTTKPSMISKGETFTGTVPIKSVEVGEDTNVSSNTLTVITSGLVGIDTVNNPLPTSGGEDEESDAELRERAMNQSNGLNAVTAKGMKNGLLGIEGVTDISLYVNDESVTDPNGLKPHHTEYIVSGGNDDEIAQFIGARKGAGDGTQGGIHGDKVTGIADIDNGDQIPVEYSRPEEIEILIDAEIEIIDYEYPGDDEVKDQIAGYIGGRYTSGNEVFGGLSVGRDVISNQVIQEILSVDGVYDVSRLQFEENIDTNYESGNVTIDRNQIAVTFANTQKVTIGTTKVQKS